MENQQLVRLSFSKQLFLRKAEIPDSKAVLLILHGLGEHIGRYTPFYEEMNAAGLSVWGFDWPGHGKTPGKRGYAKCLEVLHRTLDELLSLIRESNPEKPIFLFGHSMGGNLALHYLLQERPAVHGVIASSPWIRLAFEPSKFMVFLGKVVGRVYPALLQPSGLNPDHISRDPEEVRQYVSDPLVHDRISAGLGLALLKSASWLDAFQGKSHCPVLVTHGSADQITSPDASRAFSDRLKGDVTFHTWEGRYHEPHNDHEQEEVRAFYVRWILKRLPSTE